MTDDLYPDGIRPDLYRAVVSGLSRRTEDSSGLVHRSSGLRYRRPVRPVIRREARRILGRLNQRGAEGRAITVDGTFIPGPLAAHARASGPGARNMTRLRYLALLCREQARHGQVILSDERAAHVLQLPVEAVTAARNDLETSGAIVRVDERMEKWSDFLCEWFYVGGIDPEGNARPGSGRAVYEVPDAAVPPEPRLFATPWREASRDAEWETPEDRKAAVDVIRSYFD